MPDRYGELPGAAPLLETKLYCPRWRPGLVSRPSLVARINEPGPSRLTIVSAPAGFGKTTLLAEWLASVERPVAWVSLDAGDTDPTVFWTYVLAALGRACPGLGDQARSLLQASRPTAPGEWLPTLVNDLSGMVAPGPVIVLDDYHVVEEDSIHHGVTFLLDHLPPGVRLVVATRADPPLPLARLRARGELAEFRAADLRFTAAEAATLFNAGMGLAVSDAGIDALEARTEGWIAGLQLAGLSMRGRDNVAEFISSFAGDHRYIVDYLVEEVLGRQSPEVRAFLLDTSILERLTGPLCDAVTGQPGGAAMLASLEQANLFVVSLDDRRAWYRYHHLFADVLRVHAAAEDQERVPGLHRRASEWFEGAGDVDASVRHALAAGDTGNACRLIERAWRPMDRTRRSATWLRWAGELPAEAIEGRPVLAAGCAWAMLSAGDMEGAETHLRAAERWLETPPPGGAVVADEEEARALPASLAAARAYQSQTLGDVAATVRHASRALDLLPEDDHLRRGSPAALLAMALWANGDVSGAERALIEARESQRAAGNHQFLVTGTYVLASMRRTLGRLRDAKVELERALGLTIEHGGSSARGAADLHTGLAEVAIEMNDPGAAAHHLQLSRELGENAALPHWAHRWYLAQARFEAAWGDGERALDLVDEAERRYARGPVPDAHPVAAWNARIWLTRGRLTEALAWAERTGLSTGDDLGYLREFEHLTLARILLARARRDHDVTAIDEAVELLERLRDAAKDGGRLSTVIECLILQSVAEANRGQGVASRALFGEALRLAGPEGYVHLFIEQGEAVRDLLRHAVGSGTGGGFAGRVLSALDSGSQEAGGPDPSARGLVEGLTAREVEIVRLVAAGLRNQEIADHLVISLPTVKRHLANVYGKLGVGHRTEAVARANELKLI